MTGNAEMENKVLCETALFSTIKSARVRGHTSKQFTDAVPPVHENPKNLPEYIIEYYKIQSLQTLGESNEQVSVPIWINRGQSGTDLQSWFGYIKEAINDINFAAPGLNLFETEYKSEATITINLRLPGSPFLYYTEGDILTYPGCRVAEIYLGDADDIDMKSLSCHELLHALGIQHEHQRRDRDLSLYVHDVKGEWKPQYCSSDDLMGLTRFDPLSIMMYPEKRNQLWRNRRDSVWFAKPTTEVNRKMSELDKVGLNNLYRPCKGANYSPKRFGIGITGLWYCGRLFGKRTPGHNGYCGPTNGPNCPACRVLRSDRVVSLWGKGKWQGWTGEVYCGRWFGVQESGHDGYCGPNNGPSCPECYDELLKRD